MNYNILEYNERLKHIQELLEREEDINLEQAANYLLNARDLERPKKLQYKIYNNNDIFRKRMHEIDIGLLNCEDAENELDILVEQTATKSENKQLVFVNNTTIQGKHFKSDMSNIYLKQYQDIIIKMTKRKLNKEYLEQRKLETIMKELKYDQKFTKNSLYGTIYFKHISKESTEYNLDLINLADPEHVLVLLKYPSSRLDAWMGCISYTLKELINNCNFTDLQAQILNLWRCEDIKQEDIAVNCGVSQPAISQELDNIVEKIIKEYKSRLEDYTYTYHVKGKYKSCSKCKEVKLVCEFGNDSRNKSGFKSICKRCDNLHKK